MSMEAEYNWEQSKPAVNNLEPRNLIVREDQFDCPLCQQLLFDPITTSCGHSFCKSCILRAMDHDNRCPMCRTIVHISPEYGVAVLLQQVIQQNFPIQYQLRKDEIIKELNDQSFNLPLFLLGELVLFPHMALPLHVFEPRYRLMIRRCLEGGRRFGVVASFNDEISIIGTTAVIENHYIFPDGRSLVATVGDSRFKVLDTWDQDGYMVARVEYLEDSPPSVDQVEQHFQTAKNLIEEKFQAHLPEVEQKFGKMPTSNATEFVWWASGTLPIDNAMKYKLLESQSLESRLEFLINCISNIDTSNCTIS